MLTTTDVETQHRAIGSRSLGVAYSVVRSISRHFAFWGQKLGWLGTVCHGGHNNNLLPFFNLEHSSYASTGAVGQGWDRAHWHTSLLHGGSHQGCLCMVLQTLTAGRTESYAEAARGVMGHVAFAPPRETRDCTGKVHNAVQMPVAVSLIVPYTGGPMACG